MTRGRKRKPDATMPRHIQAEKIPAGLYWRANAKGGVWWRFKAGKREIVATETAMLSDLHALMESDAAPQGSVNLVMSKFHQSTEFAGLAVGTKRNYLALSKFISGYQTRLGIPFGMLEVDRLNTPVIQRLVEAIAKDTPTKANHVLRYLRRTLSWGKRIGLCKTNPAKGVRQAKERKKNAMPGQSAFAAVLAFARDRGGRVSHSGGSVSGYLWAVMEIAYACRLRGIEVVTLTDANALEAGILSSRRKGSLDNVTRWNGRLREAWTHLDARRRAIIDTRKIPTPMAPEQRFLVVAEDGSPLTKSGFDSAWQRMIRLAISNGVIEPAQRFSLHGLKHRGVTDTKGTRADRREASGHKTESAFGVYDHAVPLVEPAEFFR
jgi:site-specific recombinase XerD